MTNPLQQAIERSRAASDWCTTEERVFREAAAVMAEALGFYSKITNYEVRDGEFTEDIRLSIVDEDDGVVARDALAKANALFEEGEG